MSEKLDRLRATRGGNRGVITKYTKEVLEILKGESINKDRLHTINELLNAKLAIVKRIDEEILELCDTKEIEEADEIYSRVLDVKQAISKASTETKTSKTITQGNNGIVHSETTNAEVKVIETTKQQQGESSNKKALAVNNENPVNYNSNNETKTKLPRLIVQKFNGNPTKWNSFWDSFRSAIHENTGISTIDKFNYLNSLLEGSAARAIQGLTLTESNYEAAVDILKDRFGKTQIDELLKTLKIETEVREASDGNLVQPSKPSRGGRNSPLSDRSKATASSLFASNSSNSKIKCVYCKGTHYSASCDKVVDVKDRMEALKRERLCFKCLRPNHISRECQNRNCRNCNKEHHQSICHKVPKYSPKPRSPEDS